MENQISIAVRTAFITGKIYRFLSDILGKNSNTTNPIYPEISILVQSDPLTVLVRSYCQSLGIMAYEKTNLFALKRLLAECGLQANISSDVVRAICPEPMENPSTENFNSDLAVFAHMCSDPYSLTTEGINNLRLNLYKLVKLRILEKAKEMVKYHTNTLTRKRSELITVDDYGVEDREKWNKELKHFVTKVICPTLEAEEVSDLSIDNILEYIEEVTTKTEPLIEDDEAPCEISDLSPMGFELHCSTVLQRQGWNTKLTACTDDQNIDIVADGNGLKLLFQCKYYNSPVDNNIVQDAYAAKDLIDADLAVLISNSGFTTAAKELAESLNVLVLQHTQLDELDKSLFLKAQSRGR